MAIVNNKNEMGQVVPENGQKWDSTEPSRGSFSYSQGDIVPLLRCHTLIWYSQLPSWVLSGSWTRSTLQSVIETHISNVMGHYVGQCYAWDVANEAVADDGNWRDSVFYRTFGTGFLAISFNAGQKADPNTKLYYNDYNLEYNGAKPDRAVELVQIVQKAGAPIDGVGFQAHLIVGSTPSRSSLTTVLKRFTALGVEVACTELDIRHSSLPASASALTTQGNNFANVVSSCLDVAGCVGVTVWGFTDKYSWVPETFSGAGDAFIYDKNLGKKPSWTSISSVLAAKATRPPTTASSAAPSTTTLVTSTIAPTTRASTTTSSVLTSTSPSAAQQTHWGQCGGMGWTGPTTWQSPWACKVSNAYYSQCL
ncbi:glycoside hydrolase superfamily [Diplogelasinospora grovesii]|uniref:Beta-xylanase n=1 Tax=Diplogelasinospora grovesii TaxID=303347 RepID=A0AAN6MYE4_9PEZI|nr:glycoside hydrolase superfamily [Diplogelasinospora grovesii]